ncbi:MAG: Phosphatidylserine synthase [Candidatus Alkanophagales archaeon MCA70_species_1]|nr:Phosphatidylserine synthase [Candidatus Alkanophaga volatiphilum]
MQTKSILSQIRLPDIFSVLNALFGFSAILWANVSLEAALLLILLAALCDGIDGVVARGFERSELGLFLDSFADFISFGVAPSYAVYVVFPHALTCALCGAYVTCGMLRLARFNVTSLSRGYDVEGFEGLPITASGIFLSSLLLTLLHHLGSFAAFAVVMSVGALLSVLMISRVAYPKINGVPQACGGAAVLILLVFYALSLPLFYPAAVLLALISIYACIPLGGELNVRRRFR